MRQCQKVHIRLLETIPSGLVTLCHYRPGTCSESSRIGRTFCYYALSVIKLTATTITSGGTVSISSQNPSIRIISYEVK